MAQITGISGMQMGDGAGGKVALSVIQDRVLNILMDGQSTFKTATIRYPDQVKAGSVYYYRPELVQAFDYGDGTTPMNTTNVGTVKIDINTRREVAYELESFDTARLQDAEYIVGVISAGMAGAIEKDLNANFLSWLVTNIPKEQMVQLAQLGNADFSVTDATILAAKSDISKIQGELAKKMKLFNLNYLGIPKSQFLVALEPFADIHIRNAFWNAFPGTDKVLANGLEGTQIGYFTYFIDPMLGNNIPAGSSFSKDKALDTTNYVGFIFHNESIGMPLAWNELGTVRNPLNLNWRYIAKYEFGIGGVRPELITALVKTIPSGR